METSSTIIPTNTEEELTQLKNSLPKELWFAGYPLYFYQGFWAPKLECITAFQNHFEAQDTDIFATSFRKVGTTWLKSLVFAISDRANHPPSKSPLLTHNPHELVPQFESNIYRKSKSPNLSTIKSPRLFGTHVPFLSLPSSIKDSKSKIIYIFRNPFDTFVSSWLFYQKTDDCKANMMSNMFNQFFDMFCEGKVPFGPYPEHALGYWRESLKRPEKVLFIKYEDLKADPKPQLKRIAEFIGFPFSNQEEQGGVIDGIVKLCSIDNMKIVAIKSDRVYSIVQNDAFFREGVVGDWTNHLTPSMAEKLGKIMEEKFYDTGLTYTSM
ncbi:cytosolic sulfotransferase 15-like [Chenopodium quinoa]|uniref:Sulfotransferase n=1 Tax=Chenopodium quinoa TaxID=63459 RepID=A0A803LEN0_CHEQI|nr:cytosolic sulfotransferase 15-like [Chenopodium quinoa]